MKITKKILDKFEYEGNGISQDIRWDEQLPGFGVHLYTAGKKSFFLSYPSKGRKHIMTVGKYRIWTLDQSRVKAKVFLVSIDQGKNKANLYKFYLERHVKLHKKTWKDDQCRIHSHILPKWKGIKINSIKREDIADLPQLV